MQDNGSGLLVSAFETFTFSSAFTGLKAVYFDNGVNHYISTSPSYPGFPPPADFPVGEFPAGNMATWNPHAMTKLSMSVVPIPAAVWLFGSALAGLGWLRRKQTV